MYYFSQQEVYVPYGDIYMDKALRNLLFLGITCNERRTFNQRTGTAAF